MKSINRNYIILGALILLAVLICVDAFLLNKKEPALSLNSEKVNVSESKLIDTSTWMNYSNDQLGFSMLIPPDGPTLYKCQESPITRTPIKVFEDNPNESVYISQAYYYASDWDKPKQNYVGKCNQVTYTLASLKAEDEDSYSTGRSTHPFLGWKIIVNNPKNDKEVEDFIKQNFGKTCVVDSTSMLKDGNQEINIKGTDRTNEDLGSCLVNFSYKILYSPIKHKLMSVVMGQECTFNNINPSNLSKDKESSYQCYDDAMIQNFKFK